MKTMKAKIINLNTGTNTAKVTVERSMRHPIYEKIIKRHNSLLVHVLEDDKSKFEVDQEVTIRETKPKSGKKSWELILEEDANGTVTK